MPIPMNTTCIECFLSKRLAQIRQLGTEQEAMAIGKSLMQIFSQAPEDMDSALLSSLADQIINSHYGIDPDRMQQEKRLSNQFVLDRLTDIRNRISQAQDPVYAALQFAVLGNYLDFSALYGQVSFEALDEMLDSALDMELDKDCYQQFLSDLASGQKLLYITDNAGEICFDRVLAETICQQYPHLQITFCVRGLPVSNDATREDAAVAGIQFPIIDSGSAVGGTVISRVNEETKAALASADVILAKGMGNTETMFGCGYNVYYAFLVKCQRFMQFFNAPKMKPMFIRDHK